MEWMKWSGARCIFKTETDRLDTARVTGESRSRPKFVTWESGGTSMPSAEVWRPLKWISSAGSGQCRAQGTGVQGQRN